MRVGILGSGLMGGKLGTLFARAGTPDEAAKDAEGRNWLAGSSGLGNSMTNGALENIQWSDVENRIGMEEL
jgi:prephenate dehydrogenase